MVELSYNGNTNLKSTNAPIDFTQEQIEEYIKCKQDPIYFIKNYCKIVSLDYGLIHFELFGYQERIITTMHENNRTIIQLFRQGGKTTTTASYILHYVIFNKSKTVAILANKAAASREIMSRIQDMFEGLPKWLQQGVKEWNKGSFELENGSKVFSSATSASGIRGKSVNLLYVDEVGIIPNAIAESFFASVYPTISSGKTTKIILSSTPLGYNHWWKFWNEAQLGINGFIPVSAHWSEHPHRDEKWAQQQKELLGELQYMQEVEMSFLGSSATLINSSSISSMSAIPFIYSRDGLDIQEGAIPGHQYIISADTSKGVGGDYSAFTIMDVTNFPYKVVGKYRDNKISPMLYPNILYRVGKEYNYAFIIVEINCSKEVAQILQDDLEYENLISIKKTPKGQIPCESFSGTMEVGINMDKKIKRQGCMMLKSLIEEKRLLIFDPDIIQEFSVFIERQGSYSADPPNHDDLIMTLVIFGWLCSTSFVKDMGDIDIRKELYNQQMDYIDQQMLPVGYINDGLDDDKVEVYDF
jgi:hypothetical protein